MAQATTGDSICKTESKMSKEVSFIKIDVEDSLLQASVRFDYVLFYISSRVLYM